MPEITLRSSTRRAPRRPVGRCGWIAVHSSSLNQRRACAIFHSRLRFTAVKQIKMNQGIRLLSTNPRRRLHLGDSQIAFRLIQDRKREAVLSRRTLTDRQWSIIEPMVPGKVGDRGRTGADNRLFVDAILWLARGASPWRDLPPELGNWRTVHSRFRRWTIAGVWESLFNALSRDPDFEYVLVDATICKTHADATSQKGGLKLPVLAAPKAA